MKLILVATDESPTAARAVDWAADMARRYDAELLLLEVLVPENLAGSQVDEAAVRRERLTRTATSVAGPRGRVRLVYASDPAEAIVQVAEEERADIVVVGNLGMGDRKEFLLGSVPNRVSHRARCSVVIVNTAPGATSVNGRTAGVPDENGAAAPSDGQLLGRAAHIGRVMAKYGLRGVAGRGSGDGAVSAARGLRSALEELGPTFSKLGQILSTRPDLLPAAFVEELAKLQDQVPPLTEAEVVRVMEAELGVPWEDVFERIEPDPMAAGTIAQVHRAVLAGGERVVVKVQRPNAETEIRQDLGLLEAFVREAAGRPVFSQVVDLPAMIEHLSAALRRELDFRHEAANIERMREVLASFPRLDVPRVHGEILTARLLVMEEVQGIAVRDAPPGDARREAARQMLEAYYRQVLTDGFFHADPHPGNLMWWQDRIYFLDFGMVGEIDGDARSLLLLLLLAFWQEDEAFLAEVLLMLADESVPDLDREAFQAEVGGVLERFRHVSLRDLRLGPLIEELTRISLRHRVRMPASLALAGKAFGQMQQTTAELDPELDPFSAAGTFLLGRMMSGARDATNPRRVLYEAQKLRLRLSRLLEGMERVVGARPGPGLEVRFRGTERLEGVVRRAGRRVALAVTGGCLLLGAAITAGSMQVGSLVPIAMGAAGAVVAAGLLVDLVRSSE